jgi:hypothetical protein
MKQICMSNICVTQSELKKRLKRFISDKDFTAYFGPDFTNNIIKYQHLDDYQNIKQLLPRNMSFIIILIEWDWDIGHWVCLSRYKYKGKNIIEYFNSYAGYPSSELKLLSDAKRKELDEFDKHLNVLLNKAMNEFTIIYNKYPLQSLQKIRGVEVGTCGRHVILRLVMLKYFNLNLQQYIDFIKKISKESGLSYDEIVAIMIQ